MEVNGKLAADFCRLWIRHGAYTSGCLIYPFCLLLDVFPHRFLPRLDVDMEELSKQIQDCMQVLRLNFAPLC